MRDSNHLLERKMQEERMQEILLLLDHLVSREEITIKLIIDCLYDVGSVNLINRKVRRPLLKSPSRKIAKVSKPLAKVIAFRWFKRNCPQLITKWLYTKVEFPELLVQNPPTVVPPAVVPEQVALVEAESFPGNREGINHEVRRLRGQVRVLSGISIGALAALSGMLVWMNYRPEMQSSRPVEPQQPVSVKTSDSILLRSRP